MIILTRCHHCVNLMAARWRDGVLSGVIPALKLRLSLTRMFGRVEFDIV